MVENLQTTGSMLEGLIVRATAGARILPTAVPGLTLTRVDSPMAPSSYFYGPSLCVCASGAKTIVLGDTSLVHDASSFLLTAVELPTIVSIDKATPERPYLGLQINLDLEKARQVIAEIEINGIKTQHAGACMSLGAMSEDLLDAVVRLVKLTERPQDIPVLGDLIHREILYRLAAGPNGDRLRQIVRLGSPSHRIAKAIGWLREHYVEPLTIEKLADFAGMGVSTLHRHFQELTTMSPLQYQKQLRLHEARRLMLTERADAGSAAIRVGYESVTQFSREYRRLFGEPPKRDVKALRLEAAS